MIVYAESSAVLAWLLGEPTAEEVRTCLVSAGAVVTSSLTSLECARGLARARVLGRIHASDELAALRILDTAVAAWSIHDLTDRVLTGARCPFPVEPVRTLDALHLATAMLFHEALGSLTVLSLDDRVRGNASALGLAVRPE